MSICVCICGCDEGSSTIHICQVIKPVWSHVDLVLMGNIYGEFLIKNHYGALNRTNEA